MLIEALQAVLAGDSGMQSYLGTIASRSDNTSGIFPQQAPDGSNLTMPYLVLSQVSGAPMETALEGTGRLTSERWRFSCCGSTYKSAKKFSKYVRSFVISLYGSQPVGNAEIHGAWVKLEADDAVALGKGTMYQVHVDVEFNYVDGDN
jgi:hypothetical protein